MKCNVIKNAQNQVVAAYPLEENGSEFTVKLEDGERIVELKFTENELCDPEVFYQVCSAC